MRRSKTRTLERMSLDAAEALEQWFDHLRANGKTSIDGPLRWGFTFNSLPAADVEAFKVDVRAAGFDVELRPQSEHSYIGQATQFAHHTAASLAERWRAFDSIVSCYPPCALGGVTFQGAANAL